VSETHANAVEIIDSGDYAGGINSQLPSRKPERQTDVGAYAIEGEVPGYSQRGLCARGLINAREESAASYIWWKDGASGCSGGIVIRRGQVALGGLGRGIARENGAGDDCRWSKSGDRASSLQHPH
jgi:hypothetical protein